MDIDEKAPGNISQQEATGGTDDETGHKPNRDEDIIPPPLDDESPLEEDMSDVEAADSVASEHPDN
ncbi:hypothetical protein [Pseudomonas tolaasii]|uniref:hypothetical protein n=1 Tax=Pseudomonas tolaasii TaxID=29442 RepID=UPI002735B525|nr:hypothetical protein [Pseudomonas tolaasii]WLH49767.1 hypothetical protein PSH62_16870 [Pseudomonas tolaasii]